MAGASKLLSLLLLLLLVCEGRSTHTMKEPSGGGFPSWDYKGFDRFPAMYFGANETGMEDSDELNLISKHQLSGWGWQVEQQTLNKATVDQCFATGTRCDNLTFDESAASFNDAQQLQQHLKDHGGQTDGVFVYRQANLANWWYKIAGRTAFQQHPEYFHAADDGRLCWRDGPFWNFAEPSGQATEYWLNTTVAELCAQAAAGAFSAVFFGASLIHSHPSLGAPHTFLTKLPLSSLCGAEKTVWMMQARSTRTGSTKVGWRSLAAPTAAGGPTPRSRQTQRVFACRRRSWTPSPRLPTP